MKAACKSSDATPDLVDHQGKRLQTGTISNEMRRSFDILPVPRGISKIRVTV